MWPLEPNRPRAAFPITQSGGGPNMREAFRPLKPNEFDIV